MLEVFERGEIVASDDRMFGTKGWTGWAVAAVNAGRIEAVAVGIGNGERMFAGRTDDWSVCSMLLRGKSGEDIAVRE